MPLTLDPARRLRASARLQALFSSAFDESLSDFRAQAVIDLMLATLGPAIYNQAVADVRAHLQGKLDDLDGEVFAQADV